MLEFDGKRSWMGCMANRAGRTKRPVGVGQTARKLTVRLDPDALEVAEQAAEALGISRDAFLSRLLTRQREYLDPRGRPIWWTDPVLTDQEELPLTQSA